MNKKEKFLELTKNKIIVSCQAVDKEPLNNIEAITLMAKSVIEGGAEVLRLSQKDHIASIKRITKDPIIGLIKKKYDDSEVFITPTKKEIDDLLELGVDCIAIDATLRKRPNDESLEELVKYIKRKSKETLIMADCSKIEDIKNADKLDFDIIGTTLRGYTKDTLNRSNIENDYEFIKECLKTTKKPLIAEGGFWEHKDIYNVIKLGAHAVVVGSAITRPKDITIRYFNKLEENFKKGE